MRHRFSRHADGESPRKHGHSCHHHARHMADFEVGPDGETIPSSRHDAWHAMRGRGGPDGGHRQGPRGGGFGGGFGGGARRGGSGRVFGSGDLRLILLALIADRARHGYELIKDIEQQFGGAYAPSPGSVYPTLTLLEELGQIAATLSDGSKKLFSITEEGMQFLKDNAAQVEGVRARMDMAARAMSGETPPDAIFQSMHTLKAALMFHRGAWSDEEMQRVRKIIEQAAQDIASGS